MTHHNSHDLDIIKTLATILSEAARNDDLSTIVRAGPVIADITAYVEGVADEISSPSPIYCKKHESIPPMFRRLIPRRDLTKNPMRVVLLSYQDGHEVEDTFCSLACLIDQLTAGGDFEIVPRESMADHYDRWIPTEQGLL